MVTPAAKREAAGYLQEQHARSQRRAARLVGTSACVLRFQRGLRDEALTQRLREIASERPRFGYRRLHVLLAREGLVVNRKKTYRLYKQEKLHLRPQTAQAHGGDRARRPRHTRGLVTSCGRWTSWMTTSRAGALFAP